MKNVTMTLALCGLTLVLISPVPAEDKMELEIELPRPVFGGTGLQYISDHLEEIDYSRRKPLKLPAGTTNVAKGKPVTASVKTTHFGEFGQIVCFGLVQYVHLQAGRFGVLLPVVDIFADLGLCLIFVFGVAASLNNTGLGDVE